MLYLVCELLALLHAPRIILICVLTLWWSIAMRVSADGVVIARCKNEFDLSDTQRAMCLRQPELIPVIEGAEEAAREACGQQFRNDRWNCSGFNFLKTYQPRTYGRLRHASTLYIHLYHSRVTKVEHVQYISYTTFQSHCTPYI